MPVDDAKVVVGMILKEAASRVNEPLHLLPVEGVVKPPGFYVLIHVFVQKVFETGARVAFFDEDYTHVER